ncbi:MAG TPA: hypothetical protein VN280_10975 [Variovorax sp.]|nr:hypothetical protein [Variovorax sp.]
MKNFVRWLREIYRWVRRAPITNHYWWAIAISIASIVLVGASGWTEKAFRLAGMSLQLGGVLTVVWGILKTRADFGQSTVRSQFKMWAKMFPPLHPPTITATANIALPGLTVEGYGYSTHGPAADQTIEGRLGHLEDIVKKVEIAQGRTHIAVLQAEKKAQQALDAQSLQLTGRIDAVARKIEITATGGVHVSAVGAVLLFVGTVLGSAAPELSQLLAR